MATVAKVKQAITSWVTGKVLFECDVDEDCACKVRVALEMGVKQKVDFAYARLVGASLDGASLDGARLDGARLDKSHKFIAGGMRSDGYYFHLTNFDGNGWRIQAGCRDFTFERGIKHWQETRGGTPLGEETTLIINHMVALAKLRGWDVESESKASV